MTRSLKFADNRRAALIRKGLGAVNKALEIKPDLVDAHYVPNYGVLAALAGRHPLSVAA